METIVFTHLFCSDIDGGGFGHLLYRNKAATTTRFDSDGGGV